MRLCSIHTNKGVAIRVEKDGKGTFERCDLMDNVKGAWDVADAGAVDRKANRPNKRAGRRGQTPSNRQASSNPPAR